MERLNSVAETLEDKATAELEKDRLANTARRASMAESAIFEASRNLELVDVYRSIASAIELGESVFLKHIRFATQVRLLQWTLYRARGKWAMANGISYEASKEIPFGLEHVFFAEMPIIQAGLRDVARACVYAKGKSGTPGHRQRIELLVQVAKGDGKWEVQPTTRQERLKNDGGRLNTVTRVVARQGDNPESCWWDPRDDRLWLRVAYCAWMPGEGWVKQGGITPGWYKPAR